MLYDALEVIKEAQELVDKVEGRITFEDALIILAEVTNRALLELKQNELGISEDRQRYYLERNKQRGI